MIVIDLDAVKGSKAAKQVVNQMVRQKLAQRQLKSGEPILVAIEPIYWFTKYKRTIDDLEVEGFPRIGTVLGVRSVVEALKEMIQEVDRVAMSMGMAATGSFRRPVYVFTDHDLGDIERLGATPVPAQLVGPG